MALKLGTQEWINAMAERLRGDATYQEKAKGFHSNYQFIFEPANGIEERRACGLYLPDAKTTWMDEREADYTLV